MRMWAQVHNQIADAQTLKENQEILPAVLLVSGVFKPSDGVFYLQHQYLKVELAHTLLLKGNASAAINMLAEFPKTMPPHPRAAADLAPVFILRAQALTLLGKSEEAASYFEQAHQVILQAVKATPADVQLAASLLQAETWALKQSVLLKQYPSLLTDFKQRRAALEAQGQLSPWWKRTLS